MKRFVIFIIVIILLAGGVLVWRVTRLKTPAAKTEKVKVKIGSIIKSVSASGKVASQEEAELKFQTSGQLAWVGVKEGDVVSAWQAIAQLDTRELQKTLNKYLRDYSKERNDFEEDKNVTYQGIFITNTIRRILEKNQWDLEKAVLDVELKDIALKLATLVTPISGVVTQVDTPVAGVNITPATAVFKVANPQKMIFRANIDEADIASITASLSAKITLDAYPRKEFTGTVTKVAFASTSTTGGGTAFPVEISLPANEELRFKVGMNGDVEIIISQKENVLVVPTASLWTKNGKTYVSKYKNNQPIETEVAIGLENGSQTEILKGLKEGEEIVGTAK